MKKLFLLLLVFSSFVFADSGDKQITLTGLTKDGKDIKISPKQIEASLEVSTFKLYNPWEKNTDEYTGVLLDKFISYFGNKEAKSLKFIAIDDYTVDIPKELLNEERILLVTRVNNEYISLKQKGPMRLVFVDYDPSLKKYEKNLPLWLWMIKKVQFQ